MPNHSHADQSQQDALLYAELLDLFEEARQLQAEIAQLIALSHQSYGQSPATAAQAEAGTAADAPLSPEETLDRIIALLAACSFDTQVSIMRVLALGIARAARARADVQRPPTA